MTIPDRVPETGPSPVLVKRLLKRLFQLSIGSQTPTVFGLVKNGAAATDYTLFATLQ
jgi:hypothetical protein